jgi:GntR family transcriptional regulator/MocR family aminotransferase
MPYPPFIMLDEKSDLPLYRQIYEAIRHAILSGNLRPTTPLPATRLLSQELGVSRMTVINAYDQLFAEGYLEAKGISGKLSDARGEVFRLR